MALESATYIDGLVTTNPTGTDNRSQGDDHIRLLKSTIKATFPNINGAVSATDEELDILDGVTATTAELNIMDGVTATTAELNYCDGVTSNIQTQFSNILASPAFTGTPTAPTAAADTNTTQIATTAYVQTELGDLGTNGAGARTIEATTAGVPTGGSSGDITYQY